MRKHRVRLMGLPEEHAAEAVATFREATRRYREAAAASTCDSAVSKMVIAATYEGRATGNAAWAAATPQFRSAEADAADASLEAKQAVRMKCARGPMAAPKQDMTTSVMYLAAAGLLGVFIGIKVKEARG